MSVVELENAAQYTVESKGSRARFVFAGSCFFGEPRFDCVAGCRTDSGRLD